MVLRSVAACMDSSDWLQGGRMQDSGFKALQEDMLSCPRPLMDRRLKPNAELMLKCPRCDSPNTKFCYYNNYSLSQPRYFCKTCRRYWTKGGTLRNVPVGGGCRKNKRFKRTSDQPCQNNPSASLHDNEINSCSPPNLVEQGNGLNLPPVPSVYFTLLNGGADGLGVAYSSPSLQQQQHNLQALKVAAVAAADRPALTGNGNSNNSGGMIMMEVPSTAQGTARHEPLVGLSNLNAFQSPPNLMAPSGPDQTAALMQINGDLSTIFEAAHHHQNQQVPTSSPPTVSHVSNSSDRYHDGTGIQDHRLNSGLHDHQDVQWQHKLGISVEDHDLPFDHENHHQLRPPPPPPPPPPPHHDIKLRQVIMNGVQSPLGGGGEVCEENRHAAINSYNWQLPISEGLPDNSGTNINYWNGAATWPDLSCYAPYTNPLI